MIYWQLLNLCFATIQAFQANKNIQKTIKQGIAGARF